VNERYRDQLKAALMHLDEKISELAASRVTREQPRPEA
jgi:hypothetical protein